MALSSRDPGTSQRRDVDVGGRPVALLAVIAMGRATMRRAIARWTHGLGSRVGSAATDVVVTARC
jgi:hypothetical protein